MDNRDRVEPDSKLCPECGSRLAVGTRSYNGTPVTIAICTDYPDCTYFRWSVSEDGSELLPSFFPGGLADWAVSESLTILRDGLSSEEWEEALDTFTEPLDEGGDNGE